MRKTFRHVAHGILPIVLLTGFFVAGIGGGKSCNTFPKVGPNWFITKDHFNNEIPLWQNFTENKLIAQVNHRTIASLMTLFATWKFIQLFGMPGLARTSKVATAMVLLVLWT